MKTALLVVTLVLGAFTALHAAERPNLVFILADDLRWNAMGCMGDGNASTPHLDRLAQEGVRFTNHFVTTSICSVSRASIFTGQHARRHGIVTFDKPFTPEQWALTYPALLRQSGYRTGFIGKWGVGEKADQVAAMAAHFDFFKGQPGQAGALFIQADDPKRIHTTSRMGNEAIEFLSDLRNDQPFCLSISFNAPHARDGKPREFQPDDRDESLFADVQFPVPRTAADAFFNVLPPSVKKSIGRTRWALRFNTAEKYQSTLRDYYRLVTGLDREVGRLREELSRRGLAENTVIVFTSDNGFFFGERGLADKWYPYEESVRVPLVIFDPRLPARCRGQACSAISLNIDLAPTLLDLAGCPMLGVMQGRSLLPLLSDPASRAGWRTDFYYEHVSVRDKIAASEALRTERWTYLRWLDENPVAEELYDNANDSLQEHNLLADPAHASTLNQLKARIAELRSEAN